MKKILLIGISLVIILAGLGTEPMTAYALDGQSPSDIIPLQKSATDGTTCDFNTFPDHHCVQVYPDGTPQTVTLSSNNQVDPKKGYVACSLLPPHVVACTRDFISYLLVLVLQMALFAVALFGALLDMLLWLSLNMAQIIGSGTYVGPIIANSWMIFRDLGNLALIAGLIWASVAMILGINAGAHKPGELVSNIIIVAILVNFSYFFAGALIDASNIISSTIYHSGLTKVAEKMPAATAASSLLGSAATNPLSNVRQNPGVSQAVQKTIDSFSLKSLGIDAPPFAGIFLNQTRLIGILDPDYLVNQVQHNGTFFIFVTAAIMFLSMTVYVFIQISFMLLVRFILLLILLITSPVAILRFTNVEPIHEWGKEWWDALSAQLTFLPVFLLLAMISFNIMGSFVTNGYGFAASSGTIAGGFGALLDPNKLGQGLVAFLNFVIAFALLWGSMLIARNIATQSKTQLPKAGDLQKLVSNIAKPVGNFVAKQGIQSPRLLSAFIGRRGTAVTGKALRDMTRDTIIGNGAEEIGWWLKRTRARIPLIRGSERVDDVRRERMRGQEAEEKISKTQDGVKYWKDQLAKAKTAQERATAEQGLKRAKDDLKGAYGHLYDTKGARGVAKYIRDNNLNEHELNDVLEALGDEKKEGEVLAELRQVGWKPSRGHGKGGGGGGSSNSDDEKTAAAVEKGTVVAQRGFARLEAENQVRIILARKEILKDATNTKKLFDEMERARPGSVGQMLAGVAGTAPERLSEPGYEHLSDYHKNLAEHMNPETYAKLRGHYQDGAPIMHNIESEMRKAGKGDIITDYAATPAGRGVE